ncbi:MAG TPA: hypothetical protein PKE12_02450 [Kiritimatiellia bacterium]|nr:hypothetical protein [Kiritimatiellia bacterium]
MNVRSVLAPAIIWAAMASTLPAAPLDWPEPIVNGLALLQQGRVKEAVQAWSKGSSWTNQQEFIKSTTMVLGVEPVAKGPLNRVENVASASLAPSVSLYWIALIYERGVHYLWFEVLAHENAHVITAMSRYDDVRELGASLALFPERLVGYSESQK